MILFIFLLFLLLSISCAEQPHCYIPVTPLNLSESKVVSYEEIKTDDYLMSFPTSMFICDSNLIIKDGKGHKYLFHVLNKNGYIVDEFLTLGNGREEYVYSNFNAQMNKEGVLEMYDSARKRIISFHKIEGKFKFKYSYNVGTDEEYVTEAVNVGNYFLGQGMNGRFVKNRYMVFDSLDSVPKWIGEYPEISPQLLENTEQDLKTILHHTPIFRLSPDKSKAVFASYKGALIQFYNLSLLPDSINYKSIQLEIPINKSQISPNHEGWIYGFEDAFTTDSSVYLIYNGYTSLENPGLGEYVLQYDWNGNLLEQYKFDIGMRSLAVDEKNGIIYFVGYVDDEMKLFFASIGS